MASASDPPSAWETGPKQQCPCDDPSQAFQIYEDGHGYCHAGGCPHPYWSPQKLGLEGDSSSSSPRKHTKDIPMTAAQQQELSDKIASSEHFAIKSRGLTQATCRHWDYRVFKTAQGTAEHVAVYKSAQGGTVAAKLRGEDKQFRWVGNPSTAGLYGQHFLSSGKMLIVAEGEIDTLTASQLWANRFPVVGLPNGASAARKDVASALSALVKYDKVVFAFDGDKPGREAALECAKLLPAGKACIANFADGDDINAMHMRGEDAALISLLHNAPPYRPDGIVAARSLVSQALNPVVTGKTWPWEFLTEWTYGRRPGEVIILGAGTGVGKSDFMSEVVAHTIRPVKEGGCEERCAVFNYEAPPVGTLKSISGKHAGLRFHIPSDPDNPIWTEDQLSHWLEYTTEHCASLFINDHYGAVDWESVKQRIRYLAHAEDVRHFFIDPIAALVALADDDRKALDRLLPEASMLSQELGVTLYFNSHLTRPSDGKSHEEGGRVTLRHFRGSGAIGMWANFVIALERDQQSEDEEEAAMTTVRMLKDRFTGDSTGKTRKLVFNRITGMQELPSDSLRPPPPSGASDEDA